MPGPLAGVKVIDLTAVLLGPFATQHLADMGADVIKVEPPEGDLLRVSGGSMGRDKNMGPIYMAANRNKRSLCLDLTTPEGKDVLRRLIASVDVLVHNMRVEAIERLGFGYQAVQAISPKIVYCAATGFDQDGPDRDKPAFDDIIQAASGLATIASIGRDKPDFVPTLVADKTAGISVVNAVLAALFHRERTGEGQYVEVPMLETMVAFVLTEHLGGLTFEPSPAKAGYARLLAGGRKPAPTKDGFLALLPYTTEQWHSFLKAANRPDLIETLAIADRHTRNANIQKIYATLHEITLTCTTAEWMSICNQFDIPATPLYSLDELPEHPQLIATNLFQTMEHPSEGTVRYIRPPTKFARTPAAVRGAAPRVGEHSCEILREAGLQDDEINALLSAKTVKQHEPQ